MINLHPASALSEISSNKNRIRHRKLKRALIIAICVVGIFIITGGMGYLIYQKDARALMAKSLSGKDNFYAAQKALDAEDFNGAAQHLNNASTDFINASQSLAQMGSLRKIPYIKTQVSAVNNVLMAGIQTASALEKVSQLADEIITPIKKDGQFTLASVTPAQKHVIMKQITEAYPDLVGIKAEIDLAITHIDQIPEKGILTALKDSIKPIQEQLPAVKRALENALPAAEILPPIAGYPEEQTYLFLLQNNTELRPTGGFIGTYGILKIKDAEIISFKTDNIYNLDDPVKNTLNIEPPAALKKYLKAEKWFMRDSNWSPDFPTSAEKALWFYEMQNGKEKNIDGVIATTPDMIKSLLKLTGEIIVNGITFNEANFVETLQYQVERGYYRQGISESDRKEVIGVMADELMNRLMNFPQKRWGELWQAISDNITQKQLLFYSKKPTLQELIDQENWGGKVRPTTTEDFLMVVDANMASLKSDPGVIRTIDYIVDQTDEGLFGDVTITYDNQGSFDWKSTRYRTYTRVYIPKGSQLVEHSGVMLNDILSGGKPGQAEVYDEFDKTTIAGFISIEPQAIGRLHYRYKLPEAVFSTVSGDRYSLLVEKQAGTSSHTLNVNLNFKRSIHTAEPIDKFQKKEHNSVAFNTDLLTDRAFDITFK